MNDIELMIGDKVKIADDIDMCGGWVGVIASEGEDGCVHGKMWEVLFENGESSWFLDWDLELV